MNSFRKIFSDIRASLKLMVKNKMRTALTILGMTIGIASIIIVFSAGEGIQSLIMGEVELFGTDIIQVEARLPSITLKTDSSKDSVAAMMGGYQARSLKERDLEDLKKIKNIKNAYGALWGQDLVSYSSEVKKRMLFGVSADYIEVDSAELGSGRFFTDEDNNSLAQLAVLGFQAAENIFKEQDPLGKYINIGRTKYEVIGILEERGATFGLDFDQMIYLPVKTLQKKNLGADHYMYMILELRDMDQVEETVETVKDVLRINHNISNPEKDDFNVVSMKEMMETTSTITNGLTILLLLIVAVSLLVGGVGILNVMYVIVSERTAEIGLRKAVGAKFRDIMFQFLLESVLITLLGALLGIIVGIMFSYFIYLFAISFGLNWEFFLPLKAFTTSFVFALFFGIVFGILPAQKAAKLHPVEALRKE